jgi:hypothetical protein
MKVLNFEIQPWYFIPLTGMIGISADHLIGGIHRNALVSWSTLAFACLAGVIAVSVGLPGLSEQYSNAGTIASRLNDSVEPGDYIVITPWFYGITFGHYYRGKGEWTTAPPIQETSLTRYDLLKEEMIKPEPLMPVFSGIERALTSGKRVWVVGTLMAPPPDQPPPSLPPAPNGPHGWYSGDYLQVWILQLGSYLQSHAGTAAETTPASSQPVSQYEKATLWEFQGWRP